MIGFGARTFVLWRRKMLGDVKLFLREYWEWKYFKSHLSSFALGISSFASFAVVEVLVRMRTDVPVQQSFASAPVITIAMGAGTLAVLVYAVKRTWEQHQTVFEMCDHLDRLRWFRFYKNSISAVQSASFMQKGAGLWANVGLSLVKSASDSVVDGIVEHGIGKEIAGTAAVIAAEYAVRIALVAGAFALTASV